MKKTILTIGFLCFILLTLYAQRKDKSANENKWQGFWKGVYGNDSVSINIIKTVGPAEKDIPVKDKDHIFIYGWHAIKNNNLLVESSLQWSSYKWNDSCTITGGFKGKSDSLYLVIKDITRNRLLGGDMILLNENEAILKTSMKEVWRYDEKKYPEGQTFPKEVRLFKANVN